MTMKAHGKVAPQIATSLLAAVTALAGNFFSPAALAYSPLAATKVIYVDTATEISGTTDEERLTSAIAAAIQSGQPTQINLSARTYNLHCTIPPVAPGAQPDPKICLQILHATAGLRIQGVAGQTKLMVDDPEFGFAWAGGGAYNVQFDGIEVDWSTPPYTQGRIVAINGPYSLDLQIDANFPEPNHPLFAPVQAGIAALGVIIDPNVNLVKTHNGGDFVSVGHAVSKGSRIWTLQSGNDISSLVSVGDRLAYGPRAISAFTIDTAEDVSFTNVVVRTAGGAAVYTTNVSGEIYADNFAVQLAPGTTRLLSVLGEAFHVQNCRAKLTLNHNSLSYMGDDVINVYSMGSSIQAISGNTLSVAGFIVPPNIGDRLQVVNSGKSAVRLGGSYLIVDSVQGNQITVTSNVGASVVPGDLVYDVDQASPNATISNTDFGTYQGMIRLQSVGARLENVHFYDGNHNKLLHSYDVDPKWDDGPDVAAPVINGLIVEGTNQLHLIGLNGADTVINVPPPFTWVYEIYIGATNDRFYSTNPSEANGTTAILQAAPFELATGSADGRIPLYRCYREDAENSHFLSTWSNCEGKHMEGPLGFIGTSPAGQLTRALYRVYDPSTNRHRVQVGDQSVQGTERIEGLLGYVK